MKKIKLILLTALVFALLNCKKDKDEPLPKIWKYSTFTDSRDGKTYKYIKIGGKYWMAENLAYKTPNGSWSYWETNTYGSKFGYLYTWEAAMIVAPTGWHLPTDDEWKQLEQTLGMDQLEANRLGIRGTSEGNKLKTEIDWVDNGNGTNEAGFSALPGGFRSNPGIFLEMNSSGFWWCASETNNSQAWFRIILSYSTQVGRGIGYKGEGYSIRCIKD